MLATLYGGVLEQSPDQSDMVSTVKASMAMKMDRWSSRAARPAEECFSIGALSVRCGVNIETIRYYERTGLLPKPERTAGGYRPYRSSDSDRLCFIRRARNLGFSLDEVRRLLDLADQKSRSCRRVHDIATHHLDEVRAKIADLQRMEGVLASMVKACARGTMPACPLLETLAQAG